MELSIVRPRFVCWSAMTRVCRVCRSRCPAQTLVRRALRANKQHRAYLQPALTEELITRAERHMDDRPRFGQLLRGVVLDIRDTLPVCR